MWNRRTKLETICHLVRIGTTIGLLNSLHVAQAGALVDASADHDRQCRRLRSDRANTMQRLAPISSEQQIIVHFGKCCFCAVEGTVRRLCFWHHVVTVKDGLKSTLNDSLQ